MIKTYLFLSSDDASDPFAAAAQDAAARFAELCPRATGYVQSRALDEQLDAAPPLCAGVAELWFDNQEDALAAAVQQDVLAPLWRAGVSVSAAVTGRERIVMRRPEHHRGGFIKGVFPFRRKPGLGVADFQRTWWLGHGPVAARTEGAVLYVQCHPLAACYTRGRPPYDGITELHWPDVAAARNAMSSRQMREDQATDAQRFVEPGSVGLFLAEEETITAP